MGPRFGGEENKALQKLIVGCVVRRSGGRLLTLSRTTPFVAGIRSHTRNLKKYRLIFQFLFVDCRFSFFSLPKRYPTSGAPEELCGPVGDVFFAGEHCGVKESEIATINGAFESGRSAAQLVLQSLRASTSKL